MNAWSTIDWRSAPPAMLDGRRFVAILHGGTVIDGYLKRHDRILVPDEADTILSGLIILSVRHRRCELNPRIRHLTVTMQTCYAQKEEP